MKREATSKGVARLQSGRGQKQRHAVCSEHVAGIIYTVRAYSFYQQSTHAFLEGYTRGWSSQRIVRHDRNAEMLWPLTDVHKCEVIHEGSAMAEGSRLSRHTGLPSRIIEPRQRGQQRAVSCASVWETVGIMCDLLFLGYNWCSLAATALSFFFFFVAFGLGMFIHDGGLNLAL